MNNEIVVYQPNEQLHLLVKFDGKMVWLTQAQMVELFGRDVSVISRHISNIFKEGELDRESNLHFLQNAFSDKPVAYYSLHVVISVGFRVKSPMGTQFRIWATQIISDYSMPSTNRLEYRMGALETRMNALEVKVEGQLPPPEQVLMDGQMLTAEVAVERIVKTAKKRIVLIDGYCDAKTLLILGRRDDNARCTIYRPGAGGREFAVLLKDYNIEFPTKKIEVKACSNIHDRFIIADNTVYHLGASVKDAGHHLSAIMRMGISPKLILNSIKG